MKNNSLNKGILRVLVVLVLLTYSITSAQSLTGTRGLIKAPTARMYESGTLAIGMGYVPAKFFIRTSGPNPGIRSGNSGLNTFISVTPLPFLEIMFRYSHELNAIISKKTEYFPDRMFTARFNILNEKRNRPSIVLGLQDVSALTETTCKLCSHFTATYIVASKIFNYKKITIDTSIGYAADIASLPAKDFKGFFGGLEIKYNEFEKAQLLIDYDTRSINIGLQSYVINRFHTVIGLMDFEPMFILAYRYKM